ncbi:hypothetical protein [Pseudoalteromonas piscicida]|uniref:Uncharacterized protein n=1 Tax=Pseudoalteromonas piscicida TaxID=43662 RepID=A0A2A5JUP1_PSEO7|nr:hypothetical protein [Pseudoalteromonas piscicida]PCK33155.1 hypothetical protein CEX98_03285 [Pseudoalteromonas piscicida]
MKKAILALSMALSAISFGSSAADLGVSITEQPRPGVPQARWTYVDVTDGFSQDQAAKFSYKVSNYSVILKWVTNNGAQGGCNINYDVNRDNSTNFDDQTAKRRYHTTRDILLNLKKGDRLFIQSGFNSNTAPCEVTLEHNIQL